MRVCFLLLHLDSRRPPPAGAELQNHHPLLRRLPAELAARGHQVRLVARAARGERFPSDGVDCCFVTPQGLSAFTAKLLARILGTTPSRFELPTAALREVRSFEPDVVHLLGLQPLAGIAWAARALADGPPPLLHFHGGGVATGALRRGLQRRALQPLRRVLFSSAELGAPFVSAGLLRAAQVGELMETSCDLEPLPREEARRRTGLAGDPLCVSLSRLQPIKDPLTTLRGFAHIAERRPGARLHLYYQADDLLPALEREVAGTPALGGKVFFRGAAPPSAVPEILSSADLLLQASRREFSGIAVLEALACGAVPVVSDLPSMRAMTGGGRYGRHFPPGDAAELARQALSLEPSVLLDLSADCREHFQRALSFAAQARRLETIDEDVLREEHVPGD